MTWVGKTIRTQRTQLRQPKMPSKVLCHPSLDFFFDINWKFDPSWNDQYLFLFHSQQTHQSFNVKCSTMRYYQEITVRIIKRLPIHRLIGRVCVYGRSLLQRRLSSSQQGSKTLNEIDRLSLFDWGDGVPPSGIGIVINILVLEVAGNYFVGVFWFLILPLDHWRSYLVKPWFLVVRSLHSESSSWKLLGVQSILQLKGIVLAYIRHKVPWGTAPSFASLRKLFPSPLWYFRLSKISPLSIYNFNYIGKT